MSDLAIKLDEFVDLPFKATPGSAGYDLISNEEHLLSPGERALIHTGVYMAIPKGLIGMVCSRSGLALKHGIAVLNAPGIIDSDYRGEIGVILINLGSKDYSISVGDKIAQLLFIEDGSLGLFVKRVIELDSTNRGVGGFGSTGS